MSERKPEFPVGARMPTRDLLPPVDRPLTAREAGRYAPAKFGATTDGWDAYNDWLERVRQPAPPSRQAVISKSLYSIASYKTWADKARDAFDKPK